MNQPIMPMKSKNNLSSDRRRVRVLHIHVMPVVSGSGINTYLSMVRVDQSRYEVEFACGPGGPLNEMAIDAGLDFHPIEDFVQPIRPIRDLKALLQLYRVMRKGNFDIVHTHNSKGGILGRLAAWIARVPIVIHTVHGFSFHDQEPWWRRKLFVWLERMAAHWADKLIFISQPLIDWAISCKIGDESQYTKIYSGIELDQFAHPQEPDVVRKSLGVNSDSILLGLVAKLWEGKGHHSAIEALSIIKKASAEKAPLIGEKLRRTKLVFVGEGHLDEDLRRAAKELGVEDSVVFTGFRNDIADLNAVFDIAILPSEFEGMGRVLLEAMVMSRPVIATNVGGIPDVVDDGVTGILVPPCDAQALADAAIELIGDDEQRYQMGLAGRARITERFSAETMVEKISVVYEDQIASRLPTLAVQQSGRESQQAGE